MQGKTPANWFVEVNGEKQGPYTSEQIMKLLMDGALKVESKIFDSAANVWRLAADVIPYLDLSAAPPSRAKSQSSWAPPPKPTEFKDVHVVDLNSDATGGVDYFALINNQRRTIEKSRNVARAQSARELAEEKQRRTAANRQQDRASLTAARRAEPVKITRVSPPVDTPVAAAIAASPADEGMIKAGTDGILVAEADPGIGFGIGKVIMFTRRVKKYTREHKSAVSVAAALAFVFLGTYGVVKTLSTRSGREPANVIAEAAKVAPSVPAMKPITSAPIEDTLGNGRNRIKRQSGGVNVRPGDSYPRVVPLMPQNAGVAPEPQRDPPQYYNSGEPQPIANVGVPPSQADFNPMNTDPNNGVVNPPNFVPQGDPYNNDPNRVQPDGGQTQ